MNRFSIVIITFNRQRDLLSLLKNLVENCSSSPLLEEIVIVNNASPESYDEVETYIDQVSDVSINYYRSPVNLGVTGGRNLAVTKSNGDILVMLDDDSEMARGDFLGALSRAFHGPETKRPVGIISFYVKYYDTLAPQINAFPHKGYHERKDLESFETYYFAGGAHAIRRELFLEVGGYPEDFFYGMEEYDLSFRVIKSGYSIQFLRSVVMLHKESPEGRKPRRAVLAMMWRNKSMVAWKYLPTVYFFSTMALWSLHYLRYSRGDLPGFARQLVRVLRIPLDVSRNPLSGDDMKYLRRCEARLWY